MDDVCIKGYEKPNVPTGGSGAGSVVMSQNILILAVTKSLRKSALKKGIKK